MPLVGQGMIYLHLHTFIFLSSSIPKYSISQTEMPANVAYRMITDELGEKSLFFLAIM